MLREFNVRFSLSLLWTGAFYCLICSFDLSQLGHRLLRILKVSWEPLFSLRNFGMPVPDKFFVNIMKMIWMHGVVI